jgi:hypothetical protein
MREDFLTIREPISFSRRNLLHGVSKQVSALYLRSTWDSFLGIKYFLLESIPSASAEFKDATSYNKQAQFRNIYFFMIEFSDYDCLPRTYIHLISWRIECRIAGMSRNTIGLECTFTAPYVCMSCSYG